MLGRGSSRTGLGSTGLVSLFFSPCFRFQVTRTSSESITSAPASSASGSPSRVIYVIVFKNDSFLYKFSFVHNHHQWAATHKPTNNYMCRESFKAIMLLFLKAKLGDELLDYKDLAALPKIKAIYNIDRPDMLSYSPYVSYPVEDRTFGEV